ncbi:MAG: hypothetical protein E7610_03005 [Ruminococcaceae bacterium]|nr:hypothetical protein [Oscillospiraceae bacterium]
MSFWIRADEHPLESKYYYFAKEFNAPADASLQASMCGDARYQLYLNGQLVSEGPCQGSSYLTFYETEDLTPYLQEGKNSLFAKVLSVDSEIFDQVYRKHQPAFWFDGKLTVNGEIIPIETDETWSCTREDACVLLQGRYVHDSIPPYEHWSGASTPTPVPVKKFCQIEDDRKNYNPWGQSNRYYTLVPRSLPQMETEEARSLKPVRTGDGFVEFDSVNYTTAKVRFVFKAKAGTKVRLEFVECYQVRDENGNSYKGRRDAYDDPTAFIDGPFDTLIATGQEQVFVPFWYRSFRFVRVEFEDPDFEIKEFTYKFYHYPLDKAGVFECSNPRYNTMWDISRNTLLCCMHEKYVDCPFYEQQQYDMDSALEMLFTMRMSADYRMPFKSITDFSHSQLTDGMIQANYPSTRVQVIPDFTMFWILMLRDYLRYTGSTQAEITRVRSLSGTVDRALEGLHSYLTEDGLIGLTPYWHYVDWVPGWSGGVPNGGHTEPITVTSLMYVAALKAAAEMCDTIGRPGTAADYRIRAAETIENVKKHCYDAETGLFRNTPNTKEFSQHTTVWAILSGAVTGEEAGKLMDRTFDGHVPVAVCSFSMNYYMFRALEMSNRYNEYAPKQLQGWETMLDLHCTTWCENPDSPRSECHAWSSAPIFEFSSMVLGVYPTADGYKSVRVRPVVNCYDLDWAKGTIPTPKGIIAVEWKKKDGQLVLDVTIPAGTDMSCEVVLPDGQTFAQTELNKQYTCKL